MISVEEALAIMKSAAGDFGQEKIPLSQALGRVNKDVWKVDRALPPYDRVTMVFGSNDWEHSSCWLRYGYPL